MRPLLAVLMLAAAFPTMAHSQDVSADATYSDFNLKSGFLPDPHVIGMTAGGAIKVDVEGCDYGYVANAPDANFQFDGSESSPLYIYVESEEDTMLLVNGPDGTWYCDDDSLEDLNPLITLPAADDGLYNVWVGTYGEEMVSATMKISELNPVE